MGNKVDDLPKHSKIGASSMYRWSVCPGSVREIAKAPPQPPSPYAEEGTLAHEWAEKKLKHFFWPSKNPNPDRPKEVHHEMADAVQEYLDYVCEKAQGAAQLAVEKRFHLKKYHPDLFGTLDMCIYHSAEKHLEVIDYKHGSGIAVEVGGNLQLKYYGLGALDSMEVPIEKATLTIVQPRCPHSDGSIRSVQISPFELIEFSAELVDAAKRTQDPNAPLVPGNHCRFCPAAGGCPALQNKAMEVAKNTFNLISEEGTYSPQELAKTLEALPMIESWVKQVREFAYREAISGKVPPGFKLVEKRARRKWNDEKEVEEYLFVLGLDPDEIFDRKLKSPAQMEKLFKGKKEKEKLAHMIVKESTGATLVPSTDKRKEVLTGPDAVFQVIE